MTNALRVVGRVCPGIVCAVAQLLSGVHYAGRHSRSESPWHRQQVSSLVRRKTANVRREGACAIHACVYSSPPTYDIDVTNIECREEAPAYARSRKRLWFLQSYIGPEPTRVHKMHAFRPEATPLADRQLHVDQSIMR
ncbi:hypothetical protein DAEQUDRAFT_154608 [Daedalea quercina L-15889]|uniref:Uncharacterized protein n=1 Tax=Daedalea quercina L-15889 TaxID=1314783 RepID=A0A165RN47_9APHY|nr:hypothetical protein DAEQUDRAFT_154608 [Daedalea quercina L-15889]